LNISLQEVRTTTSRTPITQMALAVATIALQGWNYAISASKIRSQK